MNASSEWPTVLERIRGRVEIAAHGCWLWSGALDWSGYGRMTFRQKNRRVCRVAWCAANQSEWPVGMHALHSCDNRRCVNPAHIRPGTNAENVQEAWDRGALKQRRLTEKSHCRNGHRLSPANLVTYPSIAPKLRCRQCEMEKARIQNAKRRKR